MRGFLAVLKADPAGSRPALRRAVAVARETGQRELLSEALAMAAVAEDMAGAHDAAGVLIGEADVAARAVGHYPSPPRKGPAAPGMRATTTCRGSCC